MAEVGCLKEGTSEQSEASHAIGARRRQRRARERVGESEGQSPSVKKDIWHG